MNWLATAIALGAIVAVGTVIVGLGRVRTQSPPRSEVAIGLSDGRLAPCPASPNCVSSHASPEDATHYVEPIPYSTNRSDAHSRVIDYLKQRSRTDIITARDDYIHAESRSRIFRFIDDLELYFPAEHKVIHLRSASRVGYGDMGVNRNRYREIRSLFSAE